MTTEPGGGGGGEGRPFNIQQFKRDLIGEVRRRRVLYDADEPAYKDKSAVEDAWNEVVDTLDPDCKHDLSIDFAKKHWKALRDDFFRRDKKLRTNAMSRERVMRWPLFTSLEFLRAHYKSSAKSSGFDHSMVGVAMPSLIKPECTSPPPQMTPPSSSSSAAPVRPAQEPSPPKTGAAKRKASVKSGQRRKRSRYEHRNVLEWVNGHYDEEVDEEGDGAGRGRQTEEEQAEVLDDSNNNVALPSAGVVASSRKSSGADLSALAAAAALDGSTSGRDSSTSGFVGGGGGGEVDKNGRPVYDGEEHFARSIAATLRRFAPKVRSLAKARIQQLLFELEFGHGLDAHMPNGHGQPLPAHTPQLRHHPGGMPTLDLYSHSE